jgi:Leucine-rich repeat (LRR) protein
MNKITFITIAIMSFSVQAVELQGRNNTTHAVLYDVKGSSVNQNYNPSIEELKGRRDTTETTFPKTGDFVESNFKPTLSDIKGRS